MENTSEIRKFHNYARPPARYRTGHAQPPKKRPAGLSSDAFLNHRFLPFWGVEHRNYKALEAEFFRSADYLIALYDMPVPFLEGLVFPQNVSEAFGHICRELKMIDEDMDCLIIRDEKHQATLVTLKNCNTGQCLYYIPVNPLWQIIHCARQQPLAELLISIFAYLYQVAQIPFFRNVDSYLMYQYEIIDEWINEEEGDVDEDYKYSQNHDLKILAEAGDRILTVIRKKSELELLESRIETYRKWEQWNLETECIASDCLQLYRDYPEHSVFDNIRPDLFLDENEGRVRADQYINFYWSGNDTLNEMLFEMVNNEFQEYCNTEEPTVMQVFDSPHNQPFNDLHFEKRLFNLIDKLCDILIPYDHDQHQ